MRIPAIHMTDLQFSDLHLAGLRWPASHLPGRALALTVSLLRALFIPAIPVGLIALLLGAQDWQVISFLSVWLRILCISMGWLAIAALIGRVLYSGQESDTPY